MKRILIGLCCLMLVGLLCSGFMFVRNYPGSSSCSTPTTGDELNEGFMGIGYENTWTEGGSITLDEDASLPGSPPSQCCDEGLMTDATGATGTTTWDRGTAIPYTTDVDVVCYLYIDSASISSWTSYILVNWFETNAYDPGTGCISLGTDGTNLQLKCKGSTNSSAVNINLNQWYKVKMHLDGTNASSSYLQIDDGAQYTFTRNDINGIKLSVGVSSGMTSGNTLKWYCGYIYVDTP